MIDDEHLAKRAIIGDETFNHERVESYKENLQNCQSKSETSSSVEWNDPLRDGRALVLLLESAADGPVDFIESEFDNVTRLRRHFDDIKTCNGKRRIYLMEGLSLGYASVMGCHLSIPPAFFHRHKQNCVRSNNSVHASDTSYQLPLVGIEGSFYLSYCEVRQFNRILNDTAYFCPRTGRHVDALAPRYREETTTAFVKRKASWWGRKTAGNGWDVVILCDPQLGDISPNEEIADYHKLSNTAYQGGYTSIVPIPSDTVATRMSRHPQHSMLKDLRYYFTNHAECFSELEWNDSTVSSVFLTKISIAHWVRVMESIQVMLPSLELRLTTAWFEEQTQFHSLTTICKRLDTYMDDIKHSLLSLQYVFRTLYNTADSYYSPTDSWKDCHKDIEFVYYRFGVLQERAAKVMIAMKGLAMIAGNRQNLEEAKRIKRLNLLVLLFVPLGYTSMLFGMRCEFTPGKSKFWVYCITAIGAVSLTFFIVKMIGYIQYSLGLKKKKKLWETQEKNF